MTRSEIQRQWESAAPGWAKWENKIAGMLEPATTAMFEMADIKPEARVLDLACGAGSQTLSAAGLVGPKGQVVASDISESMLEYVRQQALAAHLENVSTILGAAEELNVPAESFNAVICRLGLMLFSDPSCALRMARHALKPGGKISVIVFTIPEKNTFMARPMQILLRHSGKKPPAPGQPGIFALGSPGVLERLLIACGFDNVEQRKFSLSLQMSSASETLIMMQEAFGAYRAVLRDCPEAVRAAAWEEVAETIKSFETDNGFVATAEVLVAAGGKGI